MRESISVFMPLLPLDQPSGNLSSPPTLEIAEPPKPRWSQAHIPELDGFRTIAILSVFVMHMFYGWPPAPPKGFTWIPHPLLVVVGHGWLGVDLFFVLSGFLITGILLDSRETPNYFRNFYARRVLRIIPIYFTCILVMGLAYKGHAAFFLLSVAFLANFHHYFNVPAPHGPSTFWSLAIEEHFYLLWPLLVRFLKRSTLLSLTLILFFGTPILRAIAFHKGLDPEAVIYEYSWFRFDGLALGAILAMWVRSQYFDRPTGWKLAGLLVGVSLLATVIGLPFGIMLSKSIASSALRYTQAQTLFAAAMTLALAYRGTKFTAPLRTRFTKVIAGLSYCLYLIHVSIGEGYYWLLHKMQFNDVAHFGIQGAVAVRVLVIGAVAFSVAALSKKCLEDPMLRLKRYF